MPARGNKGKPAAKPRAKPKTKTTQQRRQAQPGYAATMQLRAQILELRTLGRTIPQIAEQVGRAVSTVHEHLTRALLAWAWAFVWITTPGMPPWWDFILGVHRRTDQWKGLGLRARFRGEWRALRASFKPTRYRKPMTGPEGKLP